jgi:tumor protein p53-inducible protein 3
MMGGNIIPETNLAPIISKRITLIGTALRARSLDYRLKLQREFLASGIIEALADGTLKPVISDEFLLKDVQRAHERVESCQIVGKVLLKVI